MAPRKIFVCKKAANFLYMQIQSNMVRYTTTEKLTANINSSPMNVVSQPVIHAKALHAFIDIQHHKKTEIIAWLQRESS